MNAPRLALGTANWGARYGAPGQEIEVQPDTAAELAARFLAAGHDLVDTAAAYGRSEDLVGRAFAGARYGVVTKLAASAAGGVAPREIAEQVQRSAQRVGVDRLAGVLLHDPDAAFSDPGRAREVMAALRDTGLADRVGVSVYTPEEAAAAVEVLGADLIQLPCSLADQRFLISGCVADLVAEDVEVHVRSIFLNGVLLSRPDDLTGPLQPLAAWVRRIHKAADEAGRTPLDLAVAFARDATGADAVVVGAYEAAQLDEILASWGSPPAEQWSGVHWGDFAVSGTDAIDPRTWRR